MQMVFLFIPHLDRLSRPLTASEFESISGTTKEKDKPWAQSLTLSANGDVLLTQELLNFTAVVEIGRQADCQIRRLKMVSFIRVLVENIVVLVHAKHLVQNYSYL